MFIKYNSSHFLSLLPTSFGSSRQDESTYKGSFQQFVFMSPNEELGDFFIIQFPDILLKVFENVRLLRCAFPFLK